MNSAAADSVAALERIAFLLERGQAPTYRVRAFRRAAAVIRELPEGEAERRVAAGTLESLTGIGPTTARVVQEAAAGRTPDYLDRLENEADRAPAAGAGRILRAALRGDCHLHSDWSDGGSPIEEMARAAIGLGHEWAVLTDHSPRLTVARGLSADRLRRQLEVVAAVNKALDAEGVPFRLLTGIECDILPDGSLDQDPGLLGELDLVVASSHSQLRMAGTAMTRRMVTAVSHPLVDVLGHCTGRMVTGRGGPSRSSTPSGSSVRARSTARRWRSTAGPSASTRPAASSARRWASARSSPSTATPTPPASSTGRSTAAPVPRNAAYRPTV